MSRMTRKSFLLFLGLLGVAPSALGGSLSSSWVGWIRQRLGMKAGVAPSVANCGAYYTPQALLLGIQAYDPACGTGGFLLSASKATRECPSVA